MASSRPEFVFVIESFRVATNGLECEKRTTKHRSHTLKETIKRDEIEDIFQAFQGFQVISTDAENRIEEETVSKHTTTSDLADALS